MILPNIDSLEKHNTLILKLSYLASNLNNRKLYDFRDIMSDENTNPNINLEEVRYFIYNIKSEKIYIRSIYYVINGIHINNEEIKLYKFIPNNFSRNKFLKQAYSSNRYKKSNIIPIKNADLFLDFLTTNKTIHKEIKGKIQSIQLSIINSTK